MILISTIHEWIILAPSVDFSSLLVLFIASFNPLSYHMFLSFEGIFPSIAYLKSMVSSKLVLHV